MNDKFMDWVMGRNPWFFGVVLNGILTILLTMAFHTIKWLNIGITLVWIIGYFYFEIKVYRLIKYHQRMNEQIKAPFTPEQVVRLNIYQLSGAFHPFTCGNKEKTNEDHPDRGVLVATVNGWICPFCDYQQDWAHAFMADGSFIETHLESLRAMQKSMKENL